MRAHENWESNGPRNRDEADEINVAIHLEERAEAVEQLKRSLPTEELRENWKVHRTGSHQTQEEARALREQADAPDFFNQHLVPPEWLAHQVEAEARSPNWLDKEVAAATEAEQQSRQLATNPQLASYPSWLLRAFQMVHEVKSGGVVPASALPMEPSLQSVGPVFMLQEADEQEAFEQQHHVFLGQPSPKAP